MNKKVCALLLALIPVTSFAIPVRWELQDIILTHGFIAPITPNPSTTIEMLTGSFIYDADTNLYSDVQIFSPDGVGIVCTPGLPCNPVSGHPVAFPAEHYDTVIGNSPSTTSSSLVAVDGSKLNGIIDGDTLLVLHFASALTDAGGAIALANGSLEYFCPDLACLAPNGQPFRNAIPPQGPLPAYKPRIVGIAVPEPSALLLFGFGIAALRGARRTKLARE